MKKMICAENSFKTEDDWDNTLTAAYGALQNITAGFEAKYAITLGEFGTDEVLPFDLGWAAYAELHYYTFRPRILFSIITIPSATMV